ncbi:hypothetical protein HZB78_00345 [Candidatus Collierbacteria bacterium]|nr:hypothetical protein [Candidatus Collierbacteria bacterium]
MKIIFFGSDPWFSPPVLEALLEAGHEVPIVVAKQKNIINRQSLIVNRNEDISIASLRGTFIGSRLSVSDTPDAIVLAAFGPPFLPNEILNWPKYGCLNVHASLLPRWRGASPVFGAMANGDKETGVSIMKMTEEIDLGPVLGQRSLKISQPPQKESTFTSWSTSTPVKSDPSGFGRTGDFFQRKKSGSSEDTRETLTRRLGILGGKLIVETLKKLENGQINEVKQPEKSPTSYTHRLTKDSGQIDWKKTPVEIERFIRAITPWPGAWTNSKFKTQNSKFKTVRIIINKSHIEPIQNSEFRIQNYLVIDEVQLPGKNPISWKAFLAGHPGIEFI